MNEREKVVVLVSGGLDSTVLLHALHKKVLYDVDVILALSLDYGQTHLKELECACWQAEHLGIPWKRLNIQSIFNGIKTPLLTGQGIPSTTYAEQTNGKDPVPTYVPYRNGLLLSIAASQAYAAGADYIAYAAHADDALGAAYPDCSQEFIRKQDETIVEGTAQKIKGIIAPFAHMEKHAVVSLGIDMGVDFSHTYSCYRGGEKPCGACGTCLDRIAAFAANDMQDPLQYKA
jgi:7-cyano-7-deazaguanine synthase